MHDIDDSTRLREAGVSPTPQRLEVASVLFEKPQHVSADQILERLRAQGSSVSKATVYNTLHLFCERGLVREISVDSTRRFYDSTTTTHHHFYNVDSGELTDISAAQVSVLGLPPLPPGTVQEGLEVTVRIRDKQ